MLSTFLGALTVLSLGLALWQWVVARRFPLHRRTADRSFSPSVTVLKPLKGCDPETKNCLESWFHQDYAGEVHLLFGVASMEDPAVGVVQELIESHPSRDVRLIICSTSLGANAKVSTLAQLEPSIRHEFVIVSDADVRVPSDFLANLVLKLREPKAGLVNCFYRLANPTTWPMKWEAVAINADFWSQVLQSVSLKPMDFSLGAVMATTMERLKKIGGFASLVDYLADDYQLGHRIAKQGGQILLSPIVVECWGAQMNFKEVWVHQLRWARTIKICQPAPFFFSILSNATLWPLAWLLCQPGPAVSFAALVCFGVRIASALDNHRRLSPSTIGAADLGLPLVKDVLSVGIWAMAFAGNSVEWRGRRFRVKPGGQMVAIDS